MTYSTGTVSEIASFDNPLLAQGVSHRALLGAALVGLGTMAVTWGVTSLLRHEANLRHRANIIEQAAVASHPAVLENPYGALAKTAYSFDHDLTPDDPGSGPGLTSAPALSAPSATVPEPAGVAPPPSPAASDSAALPVPADRQVLEPAKNVPLPPARPFVRPHTNRHADRSLARQTASEAAANPATPAPDNRGFFQRLFNLPQQPSGTALAYAPSRDDKVGDLAPSLKSIFLPSSDSSRTAVYDISAHTVYMPNGDRLEAHSGLGNRLDDPNHVDEKNRGATPPHAYDLALRKQLFHGVSALRLNPVGGGSMFGRAGLLAHTYMLGPNGDSNGCVSFRDYAKFLQAFLRGDVTRLVVVPRQG